MPIWTVESLKEYFDRVLEEHKNALLLANEILSKHLDILDSASRNQISIAIIFSVVSFLVAACGLLIGILSLLKTIGVI